MLISPRLSFTRDGQRLACALADRIAIYEAGGASRELAIHATGLVAFADQLWTSGAQLERWTLDGRALGAPIDVRGALAPTFAGPPCVACDGRIWVDDLGELRELAGEDALPFAGRRTIAIGRHRGAPVAKLGNASFALPAGAKLHAAAALFDGASVALLVDRSLWIATTAGAVQHRIELPVGELRLAARRGVVLACEPDRFTAIDLRFGRVLGVGEHPADDVAIDADARRIALRRGDALELIELRDALASRTVVAVAEEVAPVAVAAAIAVVAPVAPVVRLAIPDKLALPALSPRVPADVTGAPAELDAELALVAMRAYAAIARAWDTRRLGYGNESAHPHEHEVAAILAMSAGFAPDHRVAAEAALAAHPVPARPATGAIGAFAAELGLSPLAVDILLVAAGPVVHGDLARLYGILANDPDRAIIDEHLLGLVLGASRHAIAAELDPRAPLVRSGAIAVAPSRVRTFAQLTVDPVAIARLLGQPVELGAAVVERVADRGLGELAIPDAVVARAIAELARPATTRIVVRGRIGAGRKTLLAALAARAGRSLAAIDATLLPRAPDAFAGALRLALARVHLAGMLPCVLRLDEVGFGELSVDDVAGEVLRAHPGPLALALPPHASAPLDPGHLALELPVLDETARLALWELLLAQRGLWVRDAASLAAKYRVGPGVMHRALAAVATRDDDATDAIEGFIRQTRDARLSAIAKRVDRLASWSSLVLAPDIADSLRELVARVRHRRQVFEQWGMGAAMATARGLTALFQGQPGTGKTLVAGVIARELGLDLYQVDLSKVMSKWIGETERNLATVFDAAEDGQVILLFDEADSLFAKRTEVRSSNDRYANLEVNYLLQRLDTFEGIAILTTNFGGSIDPAFKRRMSFRLSFPFPDEETRTELWRAHLPPQLPIGGELALDKLARKYQLAGGYIRNACLRAAFLAAQDEGALCQHHLERAVALEFVELGKLSGSGALD